MRSQVLAFAATAIVLSVTPGVSMTLMTQRVLRDGRSAIPRVGLGTASGLIVHGIMSVVGLSMVIMQSAVAFTVLRWVGACYLVSLGIRSLWTAARPAAQPAASPRTWRSGISSGYLQAFVGNVFNPKAAAFYLTALPQFIDPTKPVLPATALLVATHLAVALSWLTFWGWLVGRARRVLLRDRVRRAMQAATGVVLIGLGVRLAATTRP